MIRDTFKGYISDLQRSGIKGLRIESPDGFLEMDHFQATSWGS